MKKGAWANIPPKSNRSDPICFSPYLYRARNRVERFFNRIKQCRRVATRYDRLAVNYLAFVQLASIRLLFAAPYESAPEHRSDIPPPYSPRRPCVCEDQPDVGRAAACLPRSGSAASLTPARSCASSITMRESRPPQPRLHASLISA